jgi:hypothetical protein
MVGHLWMWGQDQPLAAAPIVYIERGTTKKEEESWWAGWRASGLACLNLQPCGRNLGRLQRGGVCNVPAGGSCPGQAATQI